MVIMSVTEDHGINSGQVNAKRFGVPYYCIGLSGIEQKFMLFSLDIYTMIFIVFTSSEGILPDSGQVSPQPF